MLLGYRYDDDGTPNPYTGRSLMRRGADRKSSPHSNPASHDAVHSDYDGDEGHENGDEDTSDNKPHVTGSDTLLNKGDMRLRKRTRVRGWSRTNSAYSRTRTRWV